MPGCRNFCNHDGIFSIKQIVIEKDVIIKTNFVQKKNVADEDGRSVDLVERRLAWVWSSSICGFLMLLTRLYKLPVVPGCTIYRYLHYCRRSKMFLTHLNNSLWICAILYIYTLLLMLEYISLYLGIHRRLTLASCTFLMPEWMHNNPLLPTLRS